MADKYVHQEIEDVMGLVDLILHDEKEERENIELYGYPADYLTVPNPSLINETYNALKGNDDYFGFVLCSLDKDEFRLGSVLESDDPYQKIKLRGKTYFIKTGKLKQLLLDYQNDDTMAVNDGKAEMIVKLPVRLLLENTIRFQ